MGMVLNLSDNIGFDQAVFSNLGDFLPNPTEGELFTL